VEELRVHFIDVGQGDSILIDLGETEILIDGGDKSPGVVAYLNDYVGGVLEAMVATHPHPDHIGGLIAVMDSFEVEEIWLNGDTASTKTYQEFMNRVNTEGASINEAIRGQSIEIGDLILPILHPVKPLLDNLHDNSIVLSLGYGEVDFLFTGDAEEEVEGAMLVASDIAVPDVEILKVGYHGSRGSSSAQFLDIVKPEVAVYMAGEGNRYGYPHEETITALTDIGAEICGTDIHGTIIVTTDGETYTLQWEKETDSRVPPAVSPTPTSTPTEPSIQQFEPIQEISKSTELIDREYKWAYHNKEWTFDLEIPKALYDYYKSIPRPPIRTYSVYVTHAWDDE